MQSRDKPPEWAGTSPIGDGILSARSVLIDLCCKAGGASKGYADAGFRVVGIDNEPQPQYPYEFVQADIRELTAADLLAYDPVAVVGSPPCKMHTVMRRLAHRHHVDLIPDTRALMQATGLPYVIENVPGAPLIDPITLCGSMFGLPVRRHRLFELGGWAVGQPACRHTEQEASSPGYPYRRSGGRTEISPVVIMHGSGNHGVDIAGRRAAMGIDWMTSANLSQAIPPAYAQFIGEQLRAELLGGSL